MTSRKASWVSWLRPSAEHGGEKKWHTTPPRSDTQLFCWFSMILHGLRTPNVWKSLPIFWISAELSDFALTPKFGGIILVIFHLILHLKLINGLTFTCDETFSLTCDDIIRQLFFAHLRRRLPKTTVITSKKRLFRHLGEVGLHDPFRVYLLLQ